MFRVVRLRWCLYQLIQDNMKTLTILMIGMILGLGLGAGIGVRVTNARLFQVDVLGKRLTVCDWKLMGSLKELSICISK